MSSLRMHLLPPPLYYVAGILCMKFHITSKVVKVVKSSVCPYKQQKQTGVIKRALTSSEGFSLDLSIVASFNCSVLGEKDQNGVMRALIFESAHPGEYTCADF